MKINIEQAAMAIGLLAVGYLLGRKMTLRPDSRAGQDVPTAASASWWANPGMWGG